MSSIQRLAKQFAPPIIVQGLKRLRMRFVSPPWEYLPEGWSHHDPKITGWNVASVLAAQKARWPEFVRMIQAPGVLGIANEGAVSSTASYITHNTYMTYAYVLALTAHHRDTVSILDWGGGIGHYGVISRELLPSVTIDYHCKEVPLLCQGGREVLPDAHFYEDDAACFQRKYDLVLVSGSLQYAQDWRSLAQRLVQATEGYLYITRLPVVQRSASFVVVQRPYQFGYSTEYKGWFFNRNDFLATMRSFGAELVREFLIEPSAYVFKAPEQGDYRGFLFRPAAPR